MAVIQKGNRKFIWGILGLLIIAAIAILAILFLDGDSGAIVAAITSAGGVMTSFIGMIVWGNRAEYQNPPEAK